MSDKTVFGVSEAQLIELDNFIIPLWRVQSYHKTKPLLFAVPYLSTKQVTDFLDEVLGKQNWDCEYYQVKDSCFCKLGINVSGTWLYKSDCGSFSKKKKNDSGSESSKSESSDALKRSALRWGVGRFTKILDSVRVKTNEVKTDKNFPYAVNESGKRIWDLNSYINSNQKLGVDIVDLCPEDFEICKRVSTSFSEMSDTRKLKSKYIEIASKLKFEEVPNWFEVLYTCRLMNIMLNK